VAKLYKAVQVTAPDQFELVEREIPEPGPQQVRVRVEAVGREVTRWKPGQRVGLGFFGGEDGTCEPCRRGDFVNCLNPIYPGITTDGGYAEIVIAEARGLALVPEELDAAEAAPLLCAGVTTYNALRNAGLRSGDLVAVQGIGGLGHLGIQFAHRMGFTTVAIGRGADKEKLAKDLGADIYIDTAKESAVTALNRMGGARAILATAPDGKAMGELIGGLGVRGKLIVVGVANDPLQVSTVPLVFGGRSISGSLTGTPVDEEDTLNFSLRRQVRPMIEKVPLAQAAAAYQKMMSGKARFRMVLIP
jgi:alcohol dehydrogenase, propanol-preferring